MDKEQKSSTINEEQLKDKLSEVVSTINEKLDLSSLEEVLGGINPNELAGAGCGVCLGMCKDTEKNI